MVKINTKITSLLPREVSPNTKTKLASNYITKHSFILNDICLRGEESKERLQIFEDKQKQHREMFEIRSAARRREFEERELKLFEEFIEEEKERELQFLADEDRLENDPEQYERTWAKLIQQELQLARYAIRNKWKEALANDIESIDLEYTYNILTKPDQITAFEQLISQELNDLGFKNFKMEQMAPGSNHNTS